MKRWHEYSLDPNAPEVMALRRKAVEKTRSIKIVDDRVAYLCSLATGKKVLDIGVVEHTSSAAESPKWLHGNLKRHAAQCVGVDVLPDEVNALCKRGYEVYCLDVTRQPLDQKFDVIIGGEVLEHIDAPGQFMENCAAMLSPGGRLAITVPNPWYANVMAKNLFRNTTFVDSADHVAWYEASVLYELGQRHGLQLDRLTGIGGNKPASFSAKLFFIFQPLLVRFGISAEIFSKSIIYEFIRT